jgi:hypothetical protein
MNRKAIRDLAAKELGLKQLTIATPQLPKNYKRSGSSRYALRSQTLNVISQEKDNQL